MDISAFRGTLQQSRLFNPASIQLSVDEYTKLFYFEVTFALDRHAPLTTKTKRAGCQDNRWLSADERDAKRLCRRLERRFRRTLSDIGKQPFVVARKKHSTLFNSRGLNS